MQPTLNPIGVLLSVVCFASMAIVFGWMFAAGPQQATSTSRDKRSTSGRKSILVPVTDSVDPARAVELACRLAADEQAKIILARVITVPLTLSLYAPLPDLEGQARDLLNAAATMVTPRHLACESRIVRDRTTAGGLIQLARDAGVNMVVIAAGPSARHSLGDLLTVSSLLHRAPCEVMVARTPRMSRKEILGSVPLYKHSIQN